MIATLVMKKNFEKTLVVGEKFLGGRPHDPSFLGQNFFCVLTHGHKISIFHQSLSTHVNNHKIHSPCKNRTRFFKKLLS